jgi:hypothetical protein
VNCELKTTFNCGLKTAVNCGLLTVNLAPGGGGAVQHAVDADVFVSIGPVEAFAVADDFPAGALGGRGAGKPPRPGKRDADGAPVHQVGDDRFVGNFHRLGSGLDFNRNGYAGGPGH